MSTETTQASSQDTALEAQSHEARSHEVEGYRISPQQERLWRHLHRANLEGDTAVTRAAAGSAYAASCAVRIEGGVDARLLRRALERCVARHDVLRTHFERLPGMGLPVLVVSEAGELGWQEGSVAGTHDDLTAAVEAHLSAAPALAPTAPGPVLEATLLHAPGADALVLRLPAFAADARTLDNLVAEVLSAAGFGPGDGSGTGDAGEEAVAYIQFAEWQRQLAEDPEEEAGRLYWRELRAEPVASALPGFVLPPIAGTDGVPVRVAAYQVSAQPLRLPANFGRRLTAVASELEVDPEVVVLAVWVALLGRSSGAREVEVAHLWDGREHEMLAGAVGPFARWLPLRCQLDPAAPWSTLTREVGRQMEEGREAAALLPVAGQGAAALALPPTAAELAWWPRTWSPQEGTGQRRATLTHRRVISEPFVAQLALTLSHPGAAGPAGDELSPRGEILYDPRRMLGLDAARLARQAEIALDRLLADPTMAPSELDLLTAEERDQLLSWRREALPASGAAESFEPVHRRFAAWAERTPEAPAVVGPADPTSDPAQAGRATLSRLDHRQLQAGAQRLARALRGLGVGADVPVGLCLERSPRLVAGLLGILQAGGAYVALDPSQPVGRLRLMLEDSRPPVVVTETALAHLFEGFSGELVLLDDRLLEEGPLGADGPAPEPLEVPIAPEQLAYVVFTSGSTGRPKGVAVEHRQLARYVDAVRQRLDLEDGMSYALVSTFAADLGNTSIFPALTTGGCLHLVSAECATNADALAQYFAAEGVDCLKIVPSHLRALEEALEESPGPRHPLLPAKRLILGGEATSRSWGVELHAASSGCRIFNHYGPSETTVGVLTWELTGRPEGVDPRSATLPLGRAIPGARVYLADRSLRPVPRWVAGEVLIAGEGVSRGYLGRPGLTAERFLPDPESPVPGGRLYRTGDLGRALADGSIEFLGRVDHQVKFHGFRVELEEIRGVLNRHDKVRDSVVVVRQDPDGRDLLVAFYISRQPVPAQELRAFLGEILLSEILPSAFVHLRRLPLTLNGKVNYAALPGFEEIREQLQRKMEPPRTPAEQLLAGLWGEVLHLTEVGITDSFFELGGHSLLATQLISRIRQVFGIDLPLRSLFDHPTVAELTVQIEAVMQAGEQTAPAPAIEPVPRGGELPLSFAQERLWLMHQLDPGSAAYNIPVAVRVRGSLRPRALAAALGEIARRHEVLRTRFEAREGQPRQVIESAARMPLPVIDLSAVDGEDLLRRLAAAESARPFRLDRLPLLRACLLRLAPNQPSGAGEHLALFTLHHIVFDAWSSDVFLRELLALYPAFASGQPPSGLPPAGLPDLPVQYADYAAWQRGWFASEALDGQLEWWRRQLGGLPEESPLPTDHPRPEVPSFRGGLEVSRLPKELTDRLLALSRAERVTPFMFLLAAFATLLHRESGGEDIVVGTDVANRNQLQLEGLIGFFVNNLVLRTDLSGQPTFRELLGRVRERTLGAFAHQDLPFDRLVRELRPKRELARMPLFQVLFVLQNAPAAEVEVEGLSFSNLELDGGTAKFDLALFLRETPEGLRAAWSYNRDLFEATTIARLADRYERLLASICERPEARLGELEVSSEMEIKEREESSRGRLQSLRRRSAASAAASAGPSTAPSTGPGAGPGASRRPVRAARGGEGAAAGAVVRQVPPAEGTTLPLTLLPNARDLDLAGWASGHQAEIEALLQRHGALLFRGFRVDSVSEFERFARAACPDLYGEYGDLPREQEGEKVYHSTPYPEEKTILFHNESSHLGRWPLKQFFYCVQAAREGGETPLVDCRALYRALPAELRQRFEEQQLLYIRNFKAGLDVAWQDFFKTDDPAAVAEKCRREGIEARFDGDDLETRQRCAAVRHHPKTGEAVFFNQVQLHHPYFLGEEMRASMLAVFGEGGLPRNVTWGDGTPISDAVMAEIDRLYWQHAVAAPWQNGDVVMVDNMLVAHARKPFTGPRKVVVAMGELVDA